MVLDIVGFLFCALVIFKAGSRLSYYGDQLAELTGIGGAWIGLILMAAVTSLPELMVGIGSVTLVKSADLAVGDVLGSCAFNLGLLALMDGLVSKEKPPLLATASSSHVLAGALGIILISLAGLGLFASEDIIVAPSLGLTSILFLVIYLVSVQLIYRFNQQQVHLVSLQVQHVKPQTHDRSVLNQVLKRYVFFASIIVLAALFLPKFADRIAEHLELNRSFVGTLLLAATTSLPEVAVSIAAVRMGAIDMAVGNLFGSNIFNMVILFVDDLFYTQGHLLKDASDSNLITIFSVIAMSAVAIIGLTFKSTSKRFLLAWDALTIFAIYVANIFLIFRS